MGTFDFPSRKNKKLGYRIHSTIDELWNGCHRRLGSTALGPYAGMYDTYGDGMVQHSPAVAVRDVDVADFCLSLAQHLIDHPEDVIGVVWLLPRRRENAEIEFVQKVRYDEAKIRYYHIGSKKLTSNNSKKYDRRFEEVPSWADGSGEAVYRLLLGDTARQGAIWQIALAAQVAEYQGNRPFILNQSVRDEVYDWEDFDAVRILLEVVRALETISNISNWFEHHPVINETEKQEEVA